MKNSPMFSLKLKDFAKGLIVAIGGAVLMGVQQSVSNGTMPTNQHDMQTIGMAGIGAGITYLLKNFFTNSNDQLLTKEKTEN